jgi:hypothetical protein
MLKQMLENKFRSLNQRRDDALLAFLEQISGSERTSWFSHDNPRQYAWELALKAFTEGELNRAHVIRIAEQLKVGKHQCLHDFDVAYDLKEATQSKRGGLSWNSF